MAHPSPQVGVGMGPTNVQRAQKGPFKCASGRAKGMTRNLVGRLRRSHFRAERVASQACPTCHAVAVAPTHPRLRCGCKFKDGPVGSTLLWRRQYE